MKIPTIRSFFALKINDSCQQTIEQLNCELSKEIPLKIKWVNSNNFHITLKFIRNFNYEDITPIKNKLELAFSEFSQFTLKFRKLGLFPGEKNPKIIWVGIDSPPQIKRAFFEIEKAASNLGYPSETRGLSPHLTIGRIREEFSHTDRKRLADTINNFHVKEICLTRVSEILFMKSQLYSSGPVYSEIFSIYLH